MRIVIVNYRYFVAGGPERYMFNIMEMLKALGHDVIPFSVQHDRNSPTPWSRHFIPAIGAGSEVYFTDMKRPDMRTRVRGFARMVYSPDVRRRFRNMLREAKPDIVYVLYYQNKMSCAVVDAARDLGIPVVQRISDYSLLAPCSHLYDERSNEICEQCIAKGPKSAIHNRCVLDSRVYSAVKALAVKVQDARGMRKKISRFVFPSAFTMSKFAEAGYPDEKMVHIPTFFNRNSLRSDLEVTYEPFALYIGRLDPDKGITTMLDAFADTDMQLRLIGFSSDPAYEAALRERVAGCDNIQFLGRMEFDRMQQWLARCLFTVVPSEWYDNLPNSLLESFAFGKCVLATDIGSLSEAITPEQDGLLFKYKDVADLRLKAQSLMDNPAEARRMGENAKSLIDTRYSAKRHVQALSELFDRVVSESKSNDIKSDRIKA